MHSPALASRAHAVPRQRRQGPSDRSPVHPRAQGSLGPRSGNTTRSVNCIPSCTAPALIAAAPRLRQKYLSVLFSPHVPTPIDSAQQPPKATGTQAAIDSSHAARLLEILNNLWLETSHASIQIYRNKISALDRLLADAPPPAQRGNPNRQKAQDPASKSTNAAGKSKSAPAPGPTARRRLTAAFKTFLVSEEDFYRSLLSRFCPALYPSDLAGLQPLGIAPPLNDDVDDDDSPAEQLLTAEETKLRRDKIVPLVHKALISFGDLARYRELYNETSSTSSSAPGGRKESKKGHGRKPEEKKAKNWSRAAECYHQARLLLPENGSFITLTFSLAPADAHAE